MDVTKTLYILLILTLSVVSAANFSDDFGDASIDSMWTVQEGPVAIADRWYEASGYLTLFGGAGTSRGQLINDSAIVTSGEYFIDFVPGYSQLLYFGLVFRWVDANSYYYAHFNEARTELFVVENDNGSKTSTSIGTFTTLEGSTRDTLLIRSSGNTFDFFIGVDSIGTFTDATLGSGSIYAGFICDSVVNTSQFEVHEAKFTQTNAAPTAANNTVTATEDTDFTFVAGDFNYSDTDLDPLSAVQITALETVGTLYLDANSNGNNDSEDITLNQVIAAADIPKLTFESVANAYGTSYDSFGFKVHDGTEYSVAAYTMTIDVNNQNDAPTATDTVISTNEDTDLTFTAGDFNFSDIDPAEALVQIQITSLETVGTLYLDANSNGNNDAEDVTLNQVIAVADITKLTFENVPDSSSSPYDSFDFKVHDGEAYSVLPYTMTINVSATDDTPTAVDTTIVTNEDTDFAFTSATFAYSDPDSDALNRVIIATLPTKGTLKVSGVGVTAGDTLSTTDMGNLTFTPAADSNGTPLTTFTFKVETSFDACAGVAAWSAGQHWTTYTVGDRRTSSGNLYELHSQANAQWDPAGAQGPLGWTDLGSCSGTTSISSNAATMSINVTAVNDTATIVNNKGLSLNEGDSLLIPSDSLSATDIESADAGLIFTITTPTVNGTLKKSGTALGTNDSFLMSDLTAGNIKYVHNGSNTTSDSFIFKLGDGTAERLNLTYSITVIAVDDDAPTIVNNKALSLNEGDSLVIPSDSLSATDTEASDAGLIFTVTTLPANGTLKKSGVAIILNGTYLMSDLTAGNVKYVHDGSNTTTDSFIFKVGDGANELTGQTYNIGIAAIDDDAPTIVNNKALALNEGDSLVIPSDSLSATDTEDTDANLIFTVTTLPTNGVLKVSGTTVLLNGTFLMSNLTAGTVKYVHDGSNTTTDSFIFKVADANSNELTGQTYSIGITPVDDDAPTVSVNTGLTVDEGAIGTINATKLAATDTEDTDANLIFTVTTLPVNGVVKKSGVAIILNGTFLMSDVTAGNITYEHDGSNTTADSLFFKVADANANELTGQKFLFTVNPIDDNAPSVSVNTGLTVNEGATGTIDATKLAATDTEETDANLLFTITTLPLNGVVKKSGVTIVLNGTFLMSDITAGNITYVHDGSNTLADSLYFRVEDGMANSLSGQKFLFTVNPIDDDAPTIVNNKVLALNEGDSLVIPSDSLSATDTEDTDANLIFTVTTLPTNGVLKVSGTTVLHNGTFLMSNLTAGTVKYVHDGSNTTTDSFIFKVADANSNELTGQTYNIGITPVDDDAPTVSVNTGLTVDEDAVGTINATKLAATDTEDTDANLVFTVTTLPVNGLVKKSGTTVLLNGTFLMSDITAGNIIYDHDGSNTTADSLVFKVADANSNELTGQKFLFTVNPIDDNAPSVSVNTGLTVDEGDSALIDATKLAATDTEDTDANLIFTVTTLPNNGVVKKSGVTLALNGTFLMSDITAGNIRYVHDGSNTTADSLYFRVQDAMANQLSGQKFLFTINPIDDDAPTIVNNKALALNEGDSLVIPSDSLSATDTEDTDANLIFTVTTLPTNGVLKVSGSTVLLNGTFLMSNLTAGNVKYVHDGSNTTTDSFIFKVADANSNELTGQTYNMGIAAVDDDAPTIVNNKALALNEGDSLVIPSDSLSATDTEDTDANLVFTVTTLPVNGVLKVSGTTVLLNGTFLMSNLTAGNVKYVHDGSNTTTDSFIFKVSDASSNEITGQMYNIGITAVDDDAPTIVNNKALALNEGDSLVIPSDSLSATDTEDTDANLVFTVTTLPVNGVLKVSGTTVLLNGTFLMSNLTAGNVKYVHDGSNTTTDSFIFKVADANSNELTGQTFNIGITAVDDDAPTIVNNTGLSVSEGATGTINATKLSATDTEASDAGLIFTITTLPVNGTVKSSGSDVLLNGTFLMSDITAGNITYVHDGSNTTDDSLKFKVSDGVNELTNQNFAFIITPVDNNAPTMVNNKALTLDEGDSAVIPADSLSATDTEANDADLLFTVTTLPVNGTLKRSGSAVVLNGTFQMSDITAGNIKYVHDGSNTTSDSFIFKVGDGANELTNQTYTINVTAVDDDAPTIVNNKALSLNEGDSLVIPSDSLSATDTEDTDANLVFTVTTLPTNGVLKVSGTTVLLNGTFLMSNLTAGTVKYVHDGSNTTTDSFIFKVADANANELTGQTFNIAIAAVDDDAPTMVNNKALALNEGDSLVIPSDSLSATDTEDTDANLVFTVTTLPTNGVLKVSGTTVLLNGTFLMSNLTAGTVKYVHDGSNTTTDSFIFKVADASSNELTGQTYNIGITAVDDDAPTMVNNKALALNEGDSLVIPEDSLSATDTEDTDANLVFTVTTLPTNGGLKVSGTTVLLNGTFLMSNLTAGNVKYVHDGSNTTTDSFIFKVADANSNELTGQTFNIAIAAVDDDAPTMVNNNALALNEGDSLVIPSDSLSATDTEDTDANLVFTVTTLPTNGVLKVSGSTVLLNGTFLMSNLTAGTVKYVHDGSNTTTDSFIFKVADASSNELTGQTYNIGITAVDDDAPTIVNNKALSLNEGDSLVITSDSLSATDTEDTDANLIFTVTTLPTNGVLKVSGTTVLLNGTFLMSDLTAGTVKYVHDGSNTTSDSFIFKVGDASSNELTGQTNTISILAVDDDAPTIVNNKALTLDEGDSAVIPVDSLSATDSEAVDAGLVFTVTTLPVNGTLKKSGVTIALNGTYLMSDLTAGTITYVHDGTNTTSDSFGFKVSDGVNELTGQTYMINVTAIDDDAPIITTNTILAVDEGATGTISSARLSATDTELSDAAIQFMVTTAPTNGQLENSDNPGVVITTFTQQMITDGKVTYVHDGSNTTSDSFLFTVSDGINGLTGQTFTISVSPVDDDAPIITTNTILAVDEGATGTISSARLSATDTEVSDAALQFIVTTAPTNGQVENSDNPGVAISSFTQQMINDGKIQYSHNGSNTTSDSFVFKVSDGTNELLNQTFSIMITPIDDDAPTMVNNKSLLLAEGDVATIPADSLSATDSEANDASLLFTVTTLPTNGTLKKSGVTIALNGTFLMSDITAGTITYEHDGTNTSSDSFGFSVSDGTNVLIGQTFAIVVSSSNDLPIGGDDAVTLLEDQVYTFKSGDFTYSDDDGDSFGGIQVVSLPSLGSLKSGGVDITAGQMIADVSQLTYMAPLNAYDTPYTGFTFKVSDGTVLSAAANTMTLTVTAVNDAPTYVKGNNITVDSDTGAVSISNWATAISAGPANEAQSVTFTLQSAQASLFSVQPALSASGTLTFTPSSAGTATVRISLKDNGGVANGGVDSTVVDSFTITITAGNSAPVALADSFNLAEDGVLSSGNVLTNDSDPEDDALTVNPTPVSIVTNGTLTLQSNGAFTYTPAANFYGVDSFTYAVSDGQLQSEATVMITVTPVNDAPILTKAFTDITVDEDNGLLTVADLNEHFSDIENGTALQFTVTSSNSAIVQPAVGASDSLLTLQFGLDQNGLVELWISATDQAGAVVSDTLTVTVTPVNDAPYFTPHEDDTVLINSDYIESIIVTEVDNDPLTWTLVDAPEEAVLSGNELQWTPQRSDIGIHTFTIVAADADGLADTLTYDVWVVRPEAIIHTDAGVADGLYAVPSILTEDDTEMEIYVVAKEVAQLRIAIFDALGNLLFEDARDSFDDDDSLTWNGTNRNGYRVQGACTIYAEIRLQSGAVVKYKRQVGVKK